MANQRKGKKLERVIVLHIWNTAIGTHVVGQELQSLISCDRKSVRPFIRAYSQLLMMIQWIALGDCKRASVTSERVLSSLDLTLEACNQKLVLERKGKTIPRSYQLATSEGIKRLRAIRRKVALLHGKVSKRLLLKEVEVYNVLEDLHQQVVNPPSWRKYERAK